MSKDITEEILLRAGFQKNIFESFSIQGRNPIDIHITWFKETQKSLASGRN